eukprot:4378275-Pleurochrysis_carterae.AAC.3
MRRERKKADVPISIALVQWVRGHLHSYVYTDSVLWRVHACLLRGACARGCMSYDGAYSLHVKISAIFIWEEFSTGMGMCGI